MTQQLKCCVPYTVISCILFYVLGVIQVTYDCQYLMFLKIDVDIFSVHLLLSCTNITMHWDDSCWDGAFVGIIFTENLAHAR